MFRPIVHEKLTSITLKYLLVFALALPQVSVANSHSITDASNPSELIDTQPPSAFREIGEVFVNRPALLSAFMDAIVDGGNYDKVKALATQLGNSEEVLQSISNIVIERSKDDPRVSEIFDKSAEIVSQKLKRDEIIAPSVGMRLFEFALFSATYLGLIYSLNALDPALADASFRSAFKENLGLYTILLVVLMRQGMGLRSAISEYFKSFKERKNSKQFFRSFQGWMKAVPFLQNIRNIQLTPKFHNQAVETVERQGLTADIFGKYFEELDRLKSAGLLQRFKHFTKTRKFREKIEYYISYLSPEERENLRKLHPDEPLVLKTQRRYNSIFVYNSIKSEIGRWMNQQKINEVSSLRTEIQERIDINRENLAKKTRLSVIEHINIQILTIGTIAVGTGLAIASGTASFDWFLSEELLKTLRTEETKYVLGVATLILPAFSLALHEFSWILSLKSHRSKFGGPVSDINKENRRLNEILDVLTVMELDPNFEASRKTGTKPAETNLTSVHSVIDYLSYRVEAGDPSNNQCNQLLTNPK